MNEEFSDVDLETIRAVCRQQSMTQWTKIASRGRLYQFVAMCDEVTQREIRHRVAGLASLSDSRGVKRYVMSNHLRINTFFAYG